MRRTVLFVAASAAVAMYEKVPSAASRCFRAPCASLINSQVPSVDSMPVVALGRAARVGPNYEFGRVASSYFLGSGDFAIVDNVAREVRLFTKDGEYVRRIGRHGNGPGEIAFLGGSASIRGDTIVVWDPASSRVSRFAPNGTFVGQSSGLKPLTAEWIGTAKAVNARPAVVAVLDDGSLIARASLPTANRTQGRVSLSQDTLPLVVYSASGEIVGKIGPIPGDEFFSGNGNSTEMPFGARLKVAARGNRIATGTGVRYEIVVYDAGGKVTARYSRPELGGARLSGAVLADYKEWMVTRFAEATRPSVRRELDAIPYPSRLPAYQSLLWDRAGRLWVQRYQPAHLGSREGSRVWDVLLPSGRWIDSVRMPKGLKVFDISSDRVIGVALDADGGEIVQVHTLRGV